MKKTQSTDSHNSIIRKCHVCDHLNESFHELEQCSSCSTAFLPLKYMQNIHSERDHKNSLYAKSHQIDEQDLIRGLYVLW